MKEAVEKVGVIILTLDQKEMTLRCLASVLQNDDLPTVTLLWDNGSVDGTSDAVRSRFPSVVVHHHDLNLGVASGRNAAARLMLDRHRPTHLLFLDNDMVVEPGFVAGLAEPFLDDTQVGQTQAKLRFMKDPDRLNDGGGCDINFVLGRTRPVGFGEIDRGQYDRRRPCVACGGAMMVRSDIFESLGGFDTAFDPFGPEDLDFSLRLSHAGYKAIFVPKAIAYHEVSHTFGAVYSAVYARHKIRHWLFFMRRHAPRSSLAAFLVVTAPWLFVRAVVREAARGNCSVFGGLMKGLVDVARSWPAGPSSSRGAPPPSGA